MTPCRSAPGRPHATSRRNCRRGAARRRLTHATSSSLAWDKTETMTFLMFAIVFYFHRFIFRVKRVIRGLLASPCVVIENVFAIEGVERHVLHFAAVEDGIPAVKQNLILRNKRQHN